MDKAMKKAYSLLNLTAFNEEERKIYGIATTPTPDRVDDVVEPKGAVFTLPVPFLWQHKYDKPIGQVVSAEVKDDGIHVEIQLADPDDMQSETLKERLIEAWDSIKSGLVRGLSIGFNGIEYEPIPNTWGFKYVKWDWLELSAVTVPANQEATITAIKSCDARTTPAPTLTDEQKQQTITIPEKIITATKKKGAVKLFNTSSTQHQSTFATGVKL